MKRLAVLLMALGLVAGTLGIEASAKKKRKKVMRVERVETAQYSAPGFLNLADARLSNICEEHTACLSFEVAPTEEYLSLEVADKTETPSPVTVQIGDADPVTYCGRTDRPIALKGVEVVDVKVGVAVPPAVCQAATTAGTVTAKFSNLP